MVSARNVYTTNDNSGRTDTNGVGGTNRENETAAQERRSERLAQRQLLVAQSELGTQSLIVAEE